MNFFLSDSAGAEQVGLLRPRVTGPNKNSRSLEHSCNFGSSGSAKSELNIPWCMLPDKLRDRAPQLLYLQESREAFRAFTTQQARRRISHTGIVGK